MMSGLFVDAMSLPIFALVTSMFSPSTRFGVDFDTEANEERGDAHIYVASNGHIIATVIRTLFLVQISHSSCASHATLTAASPALHWSAPRAKSLMIGCVPAHLKLDLVHGKCQRSAGGLEPAGSGPRSKRKVPKNADAKQQQTVYHGAVGRTRREARHETGRDGTKRTSGAELERRQLVPVKAQHETLRQCVTRGGTSTARQSGEGYHGIENGGGRAQRRREEILRRARPHWRVVGGGHQATQSGSHSATFGW
ncbi:hypothetical protein P152DRAFT_513640 [Eremomyces bilateralis CBS 781.70]|uniref:Uncharacterized protein n=1 Tax=Eremomyces bilateralis CBS 781.70 TaxID=1392243 RepID=A0A6G1G5V4_9PEZI|nr:uncharacterized protein P152DRAFT_513640 [Eremomyces bilateralis CBS 781.70]KAF1813408.1 hypothetical protein P152DRAFT_513640 [Eremomyces bilateralis CBS 781.70]